MIDFVTALALAVTIEGALYSLFPQGMKRMMVQVLAQPESHLRAAGLLAAVVGVGMVWLIRG